jgi:N-acetylmuramoyl-L-alanine amidase
MIFPSAGHNSKSKNIKQDPGAVNKQGVKEGDLTIEFRNLVLAELKKTNTPFISDSDEESLAMYLNRIKTGSGSVIVEYHFDASVSEAATGTTGLIEAEADRLDKAFAKELTDTTSQILGIKNRGVISETQSHRGRLGLMREEGIICLVELGFISNPNDLCAYHANKHILAKAHSDILRRYETFL